eukprot:620399-Rhodomonas_salina.1
MCIRDSPLPLPLPLPPSLSLSSSPSSHSKGVEFSELTVADLKGAREAFSLAGGFVLPIVEIDDVKIGNGQVRALGFRI